MRRVLVAVYALLTASAHPVAAFDLDTVTATATVATDYRFRGVSQNDEKPMLQGELDVTGADGWYAGAFGSGVDPEDHEDTSVELVLYGGRRMEWRGLSFDLSANYYAYPDHRPKPGSVRYSSLEFIGSASRTWERFTATATAAWSPSYFGDGPAWYIAGTVSYRITDWLSASGTLGEQGSRGWNHTARSGYPYAHWDAGLTATSGPVSLDARYGGASLNEDACLLTQGGRTWCRPAFFASVSYRVPLWGSDPDRR
ncbi:MAG: hypothetical protein JOZ72_02055 [Alphaproteobacteria bacterium]|nr:hypothetical protein [Alphaproteobacteria bacterium]